MIVDSLKKRSLPVTWLVSPSSVPANLSENLKENGLVFQGTWRGMAIDPAKNPGLVKYFHPKFKVCKVTNQADLNTWINLACESFGFSPHIKFTYNHVFKRFPLENRSAWEFYLVYIDAQPVATGSIFYDGDTAGIYWMATLPQFRRIGIGTHLASYLVQAAYQRGYHFVILHATVEGYPVYQRIGFKDYCQLNIYTWKPRYAGLTFSKYFLTEFAGIVNFKKIKNYLKLR
jgi:GNAT superfamily N-acetyltransferase